MDDDLIQMQTTTVDSDWPKRGLLAFTRKELKLFSEMKPDGRVRRPILGGMTTITTWPDLVLAGPILGAPQAGMVLELLSRRGVNTFLSLGWCGSIQPDLAWGDIVLPMEGFCEEGTSPLYMTDSYPATADRDLTDMLVRTLRDRGIDVAIGKVWSTDAPYRETRTKVRENAAAGILAVDMETSALMNVCRFRRLSWAGLLVVSDELWGERWRPGFHSAELKTGLEKAAGVILNVLETLAGGCDE
jgi:uridine phosphorylase